MIFCTPGSSAVSVSMDTQKTNNGRKPKKLKIIGIWGDASVQSELKSTDITFPFSDRMCILKHMPFLTLHTHVFS